MFRVAFHNLGCKVNSYEMEVMGEKLAEKGYEIVPFDEKADIYVVNTCSVTNIADRKSRQMLHQAKKRSPGATVVATGCYVQTGTEQLLEDASVDLLIGNNRKKDIAEILDEYMKMKQSEDAYLTTRAYALSAVPDMTVPMDYEEMTLTHTAEHTRAYIKIQDGCNQFCSYCIIPYARGRVRSRKPEDVIREVEGLAQAGYKEIVITGIHVSSYGLDFDGIAGVAPGKPFPHERLLDLMQRLDLVQGIERIRLGSLEPRIMSSEFVLGLSKLQHLCPHFHLSLQSGCDETLKRMNRHYNTEDYMEAVNRLRSAFADPAITTDVITGFPGETEEEFEQTERFLDRVGFYEMHIFPYSKREGTAAARRKDQLPEAIKKSRSAVLLAMEKEQSLSYRKKYVGEEMTVLFEEARMIGGVSYQVGHTENYMLAALRTDEDLSGRIISGRMVRMLQEDVLLMEIF